jgi:predicted metal-dependent phosphotriesterase family hydrolase
MQSNIVRTVLGDIPLHSLGHCQCHEHLFIAKGKSYELNPSLWMDDLMAAISELEMYSAAGGRTLVDAQPTGCGSMPEELLKASVVSKVNIIASCGFHKLCFYPKSHWIFENECEILTQYFIQDIETGLALDADFHIPSIRCLGKAGVIKTAIDKDGLTDRYKVLFSAAAAASRFTGVPIMVHTEAGTPLCELVNFLSNKGISPEAIIICHIERSLENMKEKIVLLKEGVYFQCDTIGRPKYHDDISEASFLYAIAEAGYIQKLLIGLDTTRERLKCYGASIGLDYILKSFLAVMLAMRFTQKQIEEICIINPGRAFSLGKKDENSLNLYRG